VAGARSGGNDPSIAPSELSPEEPEEPPAQ
jgi:hypothetical protein